MSLYSDAVLSLAPAAYWRLGEPAGVLALDQRWTNPGTYGGAFTLGQAGAIANDTDAAVAFTNGSVTVTDAATLDYGQGPLSIVAWVKRADALTTFQMLWAKGTQGNLFLHTHKIEFDNNTTTIVTSSASILDTAWHMVALTRSGPGAGNTHVYIDGVDVTTEQNVGNAIASNATNLRLGAYIDGSLPLVGSLDEVATFAAVLTAAQIATLYAVATSPFGVNFDAITTAIAARFAAAQVTAPAGLTNIRTSSGDATNNLAALPAVIVTPVSGAFDTGNGTRTGRHEYLVRFYLAQYALADISRDLPKLRQWTTVLVDQLRASAQLGGTVTRCIVDRWSAGVLTYAGQDYSGIELGVRVITDESWGPSS
jgi:hypothetical protein